VHPGPFSLVKWYMDCVTDAGDAAIVYCADLRWGGMHATIGNVLESGAETSTRTSLGRYRIECLPDEIAVDYPRLKISGSWRPTCSPFQRAVYEEAGGSIEWNCLQPASRVRMRTGEREFEGLGYAECLTVTVAPWRLPLRQLRWGRFVSAHHSLAWVDWQGEYSASFAVADGIECKLISISESEIAIESGALQIGEEISLRGGRLRSTILPGARALRRLFPPSIFNIREQKWKSRGTLVHRGETSYGWVIHEVVDWEL
jgi:hypothetical protein